MKLKYFFLFFQLCITGFAADAQNVNAFDGPFVSYRHDTVIVSSISPGNIATVNTFLKKDSLSLSVRFSNHSNYDFEVRLRDKIIDEPSDWKKPARIFALSDIEGEFENFRDLLIAGGVMDSLYHWTFATGHLVICGDLFDRGMDVFPELWLLYKLEDEAKPAGGYVHTILGNHDIMNLSGDFRYVQPKYIEHAKAMGLNYKDLLSKSTELGQWLRSKNIIERVGNNLCLHGGISPLVLSKQVRLADINTRCRPYYENSDILDSMRSYLSVYFGDEAPFWYRGYFREPRATTGMIDSTLSFFDCYRIIVGHTITNSNIASYYNGRVIGIDVNEHENHSEALLIENNKLFVVTKNGEKKPVKSGASNPVIQ
jgi:hypothetical protein